MEAILTETATNLREALAPLAPTPDGAGVE
jgi:hypothetical protein